MTNIKRFQLTIEVNVDTLINSYTGNDKTIERSQLPDIKEIIEFECNWLSASGIQVKDITEINN